MIRLLIAVAAVASLLVPAFAASTAAKSTKSPALASPPAADLAALAAANETQGWISLLRDPALSDWQRVALPPTAPLDARNPWRFDPATGILHCDGTGLHEMLLHRIERGDGIFSVEWRYAGTPAKPNSGIFVRTKPDHSAWHQAELAPEGVGTLIGASSGADGKAARFNHGRRRPDLLKKAGEWNVTELVCVGPRVMLHVNGVVAAELRECTVPKGLLGLEAEGAPIEFRAVRFKPLR